MRTLVILSIALLAVVLADRVQVFYRGQAPKDWQRLSRAPKDSRINFFIALKQRNIKQLEQVLYDVSHPYSPLYGQHWTYEQVLDLVAPPKEDHDVVVEWLVSNNVVRSDIISRRDSLQVYATVEVVEAMFQTQMHSFVHSVTGRQRIAHLGSISAPEEIMQYVEMISALSLFPPQRKSLSNRIDDYEAVIQATKRQDSSPWILSSHLRTVYNIPEGLRATNPKTTQAAVEFEWPGCFSYADIEQFQKLVQMPFTNVSRIIPDDEWTDTGCDGESAMDLELMLTIGSGANTAYFTNENWIYEFTQTLMSIPNPPLVTSLSWGWMEADQCDGVTNAECSQLGVDSQQYVARTDIELAKAGTMGLSVVVCTQDEGAPSDNNEDCSLDATQPVWPIYPASSAYATSVGATTLIANSAEPSEPSVTAGGICSQIICNNGTKEKVAMDTDPDTSFTSGGGFSNYTVRPSYQNAAVAAYLAGPGLRPPKALFGINNRAYPDISAAGSATLIVLGGVPQWNGGTSASTPVTSGVISLLNDYRLNNGKKPLGFLNYLLYEMGASAPQAYNDITIGNNTCTGWMDDTCCKYGYSAVKGWDPTTGWGTPNYANMLAFIKNLPY